MKKIIRYLSIITILASCSIPKTPKFHMLDNSYADIPLMPFIEDREDEEKGYFGYINSETFDIVIPAKYQYTGAFINNFAVVKTEYRNSFEQRRYKYFVINKKNEIVIENIDNARILEAEDSKNIYALTENYSGNKNYNSGNWRNSYSRPEYTTYRLYNLKTGKIAWEEKIYYADDRHIRFFDNYMIFGNGLSNEYIYKLETDGTYKKRNEGIKEADIEDNKNLISQTAKEKNLEKVFRLYTGWIEGYDWHIASIDIDLLIKNLPENMRVRLRNNIWEKGNDWIEELKEYNNDQYKEGYSASTIFLLNKDRLNPFHERDWIFSIELITKDQKNYVGLYNASKNQWAIPPIEADTFLVFFKTENDDWVSYGRERNIYHDFYNIKTREKNKYLYGMFEERATDYGIYFEGIMTYLGYYKDSWYKEQEPVIEKF